MKKQLSAKLRGYCSEFATLLGIIGVIFFVNVALAENKRGKVIDFEDELVEGVNKRPLDSLSQISERNRRGRKMHLYRKRAGFRTETQETISEMRVWQ
jgi:hypothetical protein